MASQIVEDVNSTPAQDYTTRTGTFTAILSPQNDIMNAAAPLKQHAPGV